jgi:hypothetical protein
MWTCVFKTLWYACKDAFMACMNLYYLSCELYYGVHVYLICLVICDELCLLIITDYCHNDHTCIGTPTTFCKNIWLSFQV